MSGAMSVTLDGFDEGYMISSDHQTIPTNPGVVWDCVDAYEEGYGLILHYPNGNQLWVEPFETSVVVRLPYGSRLELSKPDPHTFHAALSAAQDYALGFISADEALER